MTSAAFLFSTSLPSLFLLFFPRRFLLILLKNCPSQPKALTSSSCTSAPTGSSQHPWELSWGLSCLEKKNPTRMQPPQTSGYVQSRKTTLFSKYHFQNMPTSARCCFAQLEGEPFLGSALLLSTSCSSRGGGKKIHNIPHTFLGSLFSLSRIKCCWHLSLRFPD